MAFTFAALYADDYERNALDAVYTAPGSAAVPCKIKLVYGGQADVGHGQQDQAVIKVLWSAFPSYPSGVFAYDGVAWKVLEPAGREDGHKEGLQRALLCGAGRKFSGKVNACSAI